jgi:hypothetical protein
MSESNAVAFFFFFFYHQDIVHYEFTPEGQTVHQNFYLAVLGCLQDSVKWPEMWTVEAGSSIMIMCPLTWCCQTFLCKTSNSYPSTTPQFTWPFPSDFLLLHKRKITLERRRFQTVEDIITNVRNDLRCHKRPSNNASKCGKGNERGALLCKGTVLKEIIFNKL